jgi:DNA gyrase/topoisomerase IV subunit A
VGLKEGDSLLDVTLTDGNDDICSSRRSGMAIRFNEEDARLMGRSAAGVKGIELDEGDQVIGVVRMPMVKGRRWRCRLATHDVPAHDHRERLRQSARDR